MTHAARGGVSLVTNSSREPDPVAPSSSMAWTWAGVWSKTTHSWPLRMSRRTRLAPMRPSPIMPSCNGASLPRFPADLAYPSGGWVRCSTDRVEFEVAPRQEQQGGLQRGQVWMDDMSFPSSDQSVAPPVANRGRRWLGQALGWGIGIGAAVLVFNALFSRRDELAGALTTLEHLRYEWVFFAVVAELASIGAYAALTRQLLRAGGVDIGLAELSGITLAANAIQNSLPGGPAWSTVYAYRQFRRRGADPVLVGWTRAITVLSASATLGVIALVGLIVSEDQAAALDLVRVIVVVAVVILLLVVAAC